MTEHEKIMEMVRQKDQAPLTLERDRSALLIIDAQRYFARPEYPFGQVFEKLAPGASAGYYRRVHDGVLPNIRRLQDCFRTQGRPVIFCGAGCYLPDGRDLPEWMRDFDQLGLQLLGTRVSPPVGDPSWQFEDSIAPQPGEMVLNKSSSGPMASTRLDQILHNLHLTSVVVCGLTTAVCVMQTARELSDRGFRVLVPNDACTELSEEMHQAALFTFSYVFGRVKTTAETVRYMEEGANE